MLAGEHSKGEVLGVSLGERALLVAEVAFPGRGARVAKVEEMPYPPGVTAEQGALGAALAEFLRSKGFSARRAVFGVPAKWLVSRLHTLPPADPETATTMLRLRAESEGVSELGEMVFDVAGEPGGAGPSTMLLVALPRRWVDRVKVVAEEAGLKPVAVTPAAVALGRATAGIAGDALVLCCRADGAELAWQKGGHTRFLRHLGGNWQGAELRRALAALPPDGESGDGPLGPSNPATRKLVVWEDGGAAVVGAEEMSAVIGLGVELGRLESLAASGNGALSGRSGAAAIALALSARGDRRPAVDFLHPRLAPPRPRKLTRRTIGLIVAAALSVVAAGLYADLSAIERRVSASDHELKVMEPSVKLARSFVADMQFTESFKSASPRYLACLRDLTAATPEDGQTYLTGLHLKADMTGQFAGRSPGDKDVIALLARLSAGGRFADLKRKLDARGSGSEVSFYVTFRYVPG